MKFGMIIALILIVAGLFFLWVLFYRLPLGPQEEETAEEMQYLLDEDLDEEDEEAAELEEKPAAPTAAPAASTAPTPPTPPAAPAAAGAAADGTAPLDESNIKKN